MLKILYIVINFKISENQLGLVADLISLFADVTAIYLNGNSSQFNFVLTLLNAFKRHTGCSVNFNKSITFYLRSSQENTIKSYSSQKLSWPTNAFRYLIVTIPIDKCTNDLLFNLNFSSVFSKVKTILNLWSCRGLTLLEKITILKTLVIPKLTYKLSHLAISLPDSYIKQLNQVLFKFIWGSK